MTWDRAPVCRLRWNEWSREWRWRKTFLDITRADLRTILLKRTFLSSLSRIAVARVAPSTKG